MPLAVGLCRNPRSLTADSISWTIGVSDATSPDRRSERFSTSRFGVPVSYDDDVTDTSPVLLHLCSIEEWLSVRASSEIRPPGFDDIGFVHLSTAEQVHLPANRLFAGRTDVVLLLVDPDRLGSPVCWEPGVPGDPEAMHFPHLYGPLPTSAVIGVVDYAPNEDGQFGPPKL